MCVCSPGSQVSFYQLPILPVAKTRQFSVSLNTDVRWIQCYCHKKFNYYFVVRLNRSDTNKVYTIFYEQKMCVIFIRVLLTKKKHLI